MKKLNAQLQPIVSAFKIYMGQARRSALLLTGFLFLLHRRLLFALVPGIDTEHFISNPEAMADSWLGIGRQGLVLTKLLFGGLRFNPELAAAATLLLLLPVCLLPLFLGSLAAKTPQESTGCSRLILLFGVLLSAHPVLTEQLYFSLQSAEVVFACLLVELCLFGAWLWASGQSPVWLPVCAVVLLVPFSVYQSFVPLFIAGAVAMLLVQSLFTEKPLREQLRCALRLGIVFLAAFLLNQAVTHVFFTKSGYLAEQLSWQTEGFLAGCRGILSHVRDVLLGLGTFYSAFYGLLCLLCAVLVCRDSILHKKGRTRSWQLFLLAAWLAAPFYLSVVLGSRPVIRAQLVLPFATAINAVLCIRLARAEAAGAAGRSAQAESAGSAGFPAPADAAEAAGSAGRSAQAETAGAAGAGAFARVCCAVGIVLSLSAALWQSAVTARLYYTEALRQQGDYSLAVALQEEIARFTGEPDYDGVVIFIGRKSAADNPSCLRGDVMGHSVFDWDTEAEPRYYYSTIRIIDLLNGLGSSYQRPDFQVLSDACDALSQAPCFPADGSIIRVGDAVAVHLSEE